ncbi:MAG: zf-HC2 domain-containing protein [Planctomycetaceae bacterium]
MNCSEAKTLISAYYDGELADDLRARVSEHLDQCADCSQELRGFERLSWIAHTLSSPTPPKHLWKRIETELDQGLDVERSPRTQMDASTRRSLSLPRLFVLAATVLVAVGIGWFAWQGWFSTGHHDHFTAEFGHYLAEFRRDPAAAQQFLLAQYEHHSVAPNDAVERVGYRPIVADGVPPEYTIESTHVMKMPCCTCVQCVCQRSDGSVLVVYEHNDDDPRWFGNRPSITVNCDGTKCSLVELEDSIAASWKHVNRHITLIGIRDVAEVAKLVAWLGERKRV